MAQDDTYDGGAAGFLQRWSRRKRGEDTREPMAESPGRVSDAAEITAPESTEAPSDVDDRIDPRTGKRFDDLTDADMPTPESLTPDSDVSAFFARGVSKALRLAALRALWHTSHYNQVDLMAEYSGNFNDYQSLGSVVTQDMKRTAARRIERERERQEAIEASAREDGERRAASAEEPPETTGGGSGHVGQNDPAAVQQNGSDGRDAHGADEDGESAPGRAAAPNAASRHTPDDSEDTV